jgi:hypothetical protein
MHDAPRIALQPGIDLQILPRLVVAGRLVARAAADEDLEQHVAGLEPRDVLQVVGDLVLADRALALDDVVDETRRRHRLRRLGADARA